MRGNGPRVITDTSPLQYLFQVGALDLLPALFGRITVPVGVAHELAVGRSLGTLLPDPAAYGWMETCEVADTSLLPTVSDLGPGEREAIALARQWPGSLVILDDGRARRYAHVHQIRCTGTLGILVTSKDLGLISAVTPCVAALEEHGFHLNPGTRAHVLRLAGE